MNEPQGKIYEFGDFRLDASKRLLLKDETEAVALMPKAFETLLYLVENQGKVVGKDELLSAIWSDTIVEENNLTQNISILRRIFGEKPGENRFIATVPGKGYKFVSAVRETAADEKMQESGENLAAKTEIFAAAAETNQSVNLFEPQVSPTPQNKEPAPPAVSRANEKTSRLWFSAIAVFSIIVLITLGFYFWRENGKQVSDASVKTVAVLPFKPLVAENRNETLELGMADTLISKLSGDGKIVIRPLSAVRRYNSLEQDSLTAGRELAVEAVLDGSIQIVEDRIRVSARLLRTSDGRQLWAGQFDQEIKDIFAVQDSISERVAAALKISLGGLEKKRYTENVEAYQLYMKGRFHSLRLILPEAQKGIEFYNQAIAIDPNYALAYAGLADTYRILSLTSDAPSSETMPQAKAAALRAIELDPALAEAHSVLAWTVFFYDWDWQAAGNYCLRGLAVDPNNAELHAAYAHLLSNTGRHEQALAEIKLARELDPLSLRTNALEGQILLYAGQTDAAVSQLQKTIDLEPNFWLAHLFLASAYMEKGLFADALAEADEAGELSLVHSQALALRTYALAKAGKTPEAKTALDELLKLSSERYVPSYNVALAYNGLGERERALDYLEKAFEQKNLLLVFLKVDPRWNNLRSEPRFAGLMRLMNFPR